MSERERDRGERLAIISKGTIVGFRNNVFLSVEMTTKRGKSRREED